MVSGECTTSGLIPQLWQDAATRLVLKQLAGPVGRSRVMRAACPSAPGCEARTALGCARRRGPQGRPGPAPASRVICLSLLRPRTLFSLASRTRRDTSLYRGREVSAARDQTIDGQSVRLVNSFWFSGIQPRSATPRTAPDKVSAYFVGQSVRPVFSMAYNPKTDTCNTLYVQVSGDCPPDHEPVLSSSANRPPSITVNSFR